MAGAAPVPPSSSAPGWVDGTSPGCGILACCPRGQPLLLLAHLALGSSLALAAF